MVQPTLILPFQNRVEASNSYKPLISHAARNDFYLITTFYTRLNKNCLVTKNNFIWDWTKYLSCLQNITSSQICHNVPEWDRNQLASLGWFRFDCGTIWWYGLSKWIWINKCHLFLNMLTHNSHTWLICHKKLIHCSKWLAECYALSVTRTSVFITRWYERDSLSRNRCEWQCIAIVTPGTPLPAVSSGAPVRSIEKTTSSLHLPY